MFDYGIFTAAATLFTVILAILAGQWRLSSWIGKQFSDVKQDMYKIKDELIRKLEYHEEHDDRRFGQIHDDIWTIKVRNAAKDVQMDLISNNVIGQSTLAHKKELKKILAREGLEEGNS